MSEKVVFEAWAVLNAKGQPFYAGENLAVYPTKRMAIREQLRKTEKPVRVRVTVEPIEEGEG